MNKLKQVKNIIITKPQKLDCGKEISNFPIIKTFQNENLKIFKKEMENVFKIVQTHKPAASKKQSQEIYLIGQKLHE